MFRRVNKFEDEAKDHCSSLAGAFGIEENARSGESEFGDAPAKPLASSLSGRRALIVTSCRHFLAGTPLQRKYPPLGLSG